MHAKSPELRATLVAGGADPNLLVDKEGNSLVHMAESGEQIMMLLRNPLIDVNATNKVGSSVVDVNARAEIYHQIEF